MAMNSQLLAVVQHIESERGVSREIVLQAIEQAISQAARKNRDVTNDLRVVIDRKDLSLHVFDTLVASDEDTGPGFISIARAIRANHGKPVAEGDTIEIEMPASRLGRIAAQTSRQMIMQKAKEQDVIREADAPYGSKVPASPVRTPVTYDIGGGSSPDSAGTLLPSGTFSEKTSQDTCEAGRASEAGSGSPFRTEMSRAGENLGPADAASAQQKLPGDNTQDGSAGESSLHRSADSQEHTLTASEKISGTGAGRGSEKNEELYEQQTLPGFLDIAAKPDRRILGCAFRTYWIVEYGDRLFMIDQHAAHEKVLYTRFMKEYETSSVSSQQIEPPIVVSLNMDEQALYEEYSDAFSRAGFEIEPFGGREYKISAVPHHMSALGSKRLFNEMLDHLEVSSDPKKLEIYIHRVATEACKAAVKGGDVLSVREAEALLDELFTCEDPYHCPHGRPTIISFSEKDLEKRFKRII